MCPKTHQLLTPRGKVRALPPALPHLISQPFLVAESHHLASSRGSNSHRAQENRKPELQQLLGILVYGQGCFGSTQSYQSSTPTFDLPNCLLLSCRSSFCCISHRKSFGCYNENKLQETHGLGIQE